MYVYVCMYENNSEVYFLDMDLWWGPKSPRDPLFFVK